MNSEALERSNSMDIRNSFAAMKRAARRAREIGRISGTGIVIQKNGRIVRIPPEQLEFQTDDGDESELDG